MNHVTMSGKAWEPDIRYAKTGTCMAEISLSVYDGKDQQTQKAKYFSIKVKAFKDLAEQIGNSVTKGDRLIVTGRLTEERWEKDGETKRRMVLIADAIGSEINNSPKANNESKVDFGGFGKDVTDEQIPF